MNFQDAKQSVALVLATGDVPLLVGNSGIGKTALAAGLAKDRNWELITIDANLLKEGEIGGLPMVAQSGAVAVTSYAIHHTLKQAEELALSGRQVLLFIDELNRCEHAVQQELMNIILNRQINGFVLPAAVHVMAAMNPSGKYGDDYDYQVVEMDGAQENRFVWLFMETDAEQWCEWATANELEEAVIRFIATYPAYLYQVKEGEIRATPRSYERVSKALAVYRQGGVPRHIFKEVVEGNIGKVLTEEFLGFLERDFRAFPTFEAVFSKEHLAAEIRERIVTEQQSGLLLLGQKLLTELENRMRELIEDGEQERLSELQFLLERWLEVLELYPLDLRLGIMKLMKQQTACLYPFALEQESFRNLYFSTYESAKGVTD
ncbi:MAG: ATP-binding protein [Lachnospiraceae bacterium]|nr:ATP-binding protein [Lachnospiraceae bacterium]MDY5741430.1 ATP-binding protein [Lachnospiraceae bacterium]